MMKFSKFYLNIIIKKPYVFIFTILISVFILVFMLVNIKVDIIETYEVKLETSEGISLVKIDTNKALHNFQNNRVLIYINRNNTIVQINVKEIKIDDECYLLIFNETEKLNDFVGKENLKMDIFVGKESLLSRIFLRGGKDYAQ